MDTVVYPQPSISQFVDTHFIPVKLNLAETAEAAQARELVPLWTPTFVISDGRGREVHREVGYLPAEDFLPMLTLAYAKGLFATARGEEAMEVLGGAVERYTVGTFAPEIVYWRALVGYNVTHDREQLQHYWGLLRQAFPDSTWAVRSSFPRD
ncbi:MAG TPA: hypothetical protein VK066_16330 [Chloroflexota bacterium]|nr:hypothetical protein [Chloroflexota bacterium]